MFYFYSLPFLLVVFRLSDAYSSFFVLIIFLLCIPAKPFGIVHLGIKKRQNSYI